MNRTISDILNNDIVGVIKSFLYVEFPPTITIEEAQFIIYINSLKMKELKTICKENKIKQSSGGVSNKYVVRLNIVGWKLSKNIIDTPSPIARYIRFDGIREECKFTKIPY